MGNIIQYVSEDKKRRANVFAGNNNSRYYSVAMLDENNKFTKKTHCNYDTANNIAREFIERE